ncbi:MAG: hypothetical protein KJ666_08805 [Bacteroidetes bacterium]|nr:hypothetical protein [Bacteroidota bacterium]
MRKNRKRQKNRDSRQLELFDCQQKRPEESKTGGIGKEIHSGVELLSRLERERTLTSSIG